ncbi:MAG: O-antigen ligase family protein [Saprospiraceae bacterium]
MLSILNFKEKRLIFLLLIVGSAILANTVVGGLGGLVTLVVMALLIFKKEYALALVLTMITLTFSDNRAIFFSFAKDVKPVMILLLAFGSFFIKSKNQILTYFIPFFIIASICFFRNQAILLSFQKTLSLLLLIFSVPLIINQLITQSRNQIKLIFYIPLLILLVGLILRFLSPDFTSLGGRYRGLLGNPNGLGMFILVYFLLFQTVRSVFGNIFSNSEKWILLSLLVISLILCGSRTSMIVIILFFAFKYVFRFNLLVALFLCGVLFTAAQYVITNIALIITAIGLEEYLRLDTIEEGSGRVIAWNFAWENIKKTPLIGNGFTYTEQVFNKNRLSLSILGHQGNAHNSYLTIWLDTGFFGVLFYYGAMIVLFIKCFKHYRIAIPLLLCFGFSANMESWLAASLNPFTIVFFIILTLLTIPPEEINQHSEDEVNESFTAPTLSA